MRWYLIDVVAKKHDDRSIKRLTAYFGTKVGRLHVLNAAESARVPHGLDVFAGAVCGCGAEFEGRLGHEEHRVGGGALGARGAHEQRVARRGEHSIARRLARVDQLAALDDHLRPIAEELRPPQTQVGHLVGLERADGVRAAAQYGRIDCVLGHIVFDALIVVCRCRWRRRRSVELLLHFARQLPRLGDELTARGARHLTTSGGRRRR